MQSHVDVIRNKEGTGKQRAGNGKQAELSHRVHGDCTETRWEGEKFTMGSSGRMRLTRCRLGVWSLEGTAALSVRGPQPALGTSSVPEPAAMGDWLRLVIASTC